MNFRITDDGDARDIHEIYGLLKAYNLSRREASQNVPIGVLLEYSLKLCEQTDILEQLRELEKWKMESEER